MVDLRQYAAMSSLFSAPKPPKPFVAPPPAREASGESAFQAREARKRAAGASGFQSTLLTPQQGPGKTILG